MALPNFSFRCLAYQEKDGTFTGVCLDLDIVEERHKTIYDAVLSINDAIYSHLAAAAEDGFPPESLWRPAPKEYWRKLEKLIKRKERPKLPMQIYSFPYFPLAEFYRVYEQSTQISRGDY